MSDNGSARLLGIGDFSRLAMLSVRMLRHYDERGVLAPAHVDPASGYRYYSPTQLRTAGRIRALRDAGCGVAQIATLLPLFGNADALREALAEHARSLDAAARVIAGQRSLLETIITRLEEPTMSITVEERTLPALPVLTLRRTIPSYDAEGELWGELMAALGPGGADPSRLGRLAGATFHDDDYREHDVDVAVWMEYHGDYHQTGDITRARFPEQRVAWATLYGPYDGIGAVFEAIGAWTAEHGHAPAGPMFNIYVVGPSNDPDPANWVTEVNYPIA